MVAMLHVSKSKIHPGFAGMEHARHLVTKVVAGQSPGGFRMRRLQVLAIAFVSAVLILAAGSPVAGQVGTPQAEEEGFPLPTGVTAERLAAVPAQALPLAPAILELVRFTFAPGAVLQLPEESPSLALVYVESGTLTARIAEPVLITRVMPMDIPSTPEAIAAGTEFIAGPGDSFVGPPHVAVEARNDGSEPLALLMAVLEPAAGMRAATPAP
jgi:quercetin dioxygenase-like cupin family protein